MSRCVVAHYHEIALKGRNRPFFVQRLVSNVLRLVPGVQNIRPVNSSLLLTLAPDIPWERVQSGLSHVFGLANFAPAVRCGRDMDSLKSAVREIAGQKSFASFRISARRGDKSFPKTSRQINEELGSFMQSLRAVPVSLNHPELNIRVEVLRREALVYVERYPGPGGLPVGTGGRVVSLLSGGIDSPVAAWRMMKRGCEVVFAHFHSYPFLDASSLRKAKELVEALSPFQGPARLYLLPIGEAQRQVVLAAPSPYRTLLYRRLMLRLAERLAELEGAQALVTGESLGQVASQTLENLSAVEAAARLPVLRPLIGMDKLEIIEQAQQIGTYQLSIQPDQDCCQLFMPRNPATRAARRDLESAEDSLDLPELERICLREVERVDFFKGEQNTTRIELGLKNGSEAASTPRAPLSVTAVAAGGWE